jgi:HEAT repeats
MKITHLAGVVLLLLLTSCGESDAPGGRTVRALARAAEDEDPWVRRLAIDGLSSRCFDGAVAIPALIRALGDRVLPNRVAAALALGKRGEAAAPAIDRLLDMVVGATGIERDMAAWALAEIGAPAREKAGPILEVRGYALRELTLATVPWFQERESADDRIRLPVLLDRSGRFETRGLRLDVAGLKRQLRERAERERDHRSPYPSSLHMILAVDESLPWVAAESLLTICADPEVRLPDCSFAVLTATDWGARDLECKIPWEALYRPAPDSPAIPPADVAIRLGSTGSDLGELRGRLEELTETKEWALVGVSAERWVSVREVLCVFSEIDRADHCVRPEDLRVEEIERHLASGASPADGSDSGAPPKILQRLIEQARKETRPRVLFEWEARAR